MDASSPLLDPIHCACFNLRGTARAVTQAYDAALRPLGLRCTQFSLLAHLAGQPPIAVTELAERMLMDRTTLSRNLRPLAKRGLVAMAPGRDARTHEVALSAAGRALLEQALPLWQGVQARIAEALGDDALHRLLERLATTRDALARLHP